MNDLIVALGLVLVIEGIVWGLSPVMGVKLLEAASRTSPQTLRLCGFASVALGVGLVWFVRGS